MHIAGSAHRRQSGYSCADAPIPEFHRLRRRAFQNLPTCPQDSIQEPLNSRLHPQIRRTGKPCFIGTRITVYDVLDYLASGMTGDDIVHDFPELTDKHVRAAIESRYGGQIA